MENDSLPGIPQRATLRKEFVKCGNTKCGRIHPRHGPYLYAYWKESGKTCKKYVGISKEEYIERMRLRERAKKYDDRIPLQFLRKIELIEMYADFDEIAQKYLEKLKKHECRVDWAYRQVQAHMREVFLNMRRADLDPEDPVKLKRYIDYQKERMKRPPQSDDGYLTPELGNPIGS